MLPNSPMVWPEGDGLSPLFLQGICEDNLWDLELGIRDISEEGC